MLKLAVWRKWVTMVSLFVTLPVQLLLLLYFRVARHSSTIAQELHIDKMAKRRTAAELEIKRQTTLAALKAKKFNVAAVARALGYTTRYIKAQIVKYKKRNSVSALPRSGRPKALNAAQVEAAAAAVLEHQSVAKAAAALKQQGTIASSICTQTVLRAVKNVLDLAPVQQQPILTSETKQKRIAFCNQQHDSDRIIAIDSTYLTLSSTPRRRKKWVEKGTKPVACKPVKGKQLHVYAGVTKYGVTRLIRVTGSTGHPKKYFKYVKKLKALVQHTGVGAEEFQEVLWEELQPDAEGIFSAAGVQDWVYLLDGASPHTARSTADFMCDKGIRIIADWPPYSPDLNPIENAWAWLKQQLYAQQYASLEAMWEAAQAIWASMPLSMCQNLMNSIATRKAVCIARGGGHTGY
jgi:hypothetical protein